MGIDVEIYPETFDGERWRPSAPLVENEDYAPTDAPIQSRLRPQRLFEYCVRRPFARFSVDIVPYRGLPRDVSPEIADFEGPRHDDGLFGHSWVSLEELLAFERGSKLDAEDRGILREQILPKLRTFGSPRFVRIVFWLTG